MANYKLVDADQLDADMTAVAESIRTKGGTTEQLPWPDGFKAAVEAIPTGAQKSAGTFNTNSLGTATVNCGFKPDAVYITSRILASQQSAIFSEGSTTAEIATYETSGNYAFVGVDLTQKSTGFSVDAEYCDWTFDWTSVGSVSFNYVALKYT